MTKPREPMGRLSRDDAGGGVPWWVIGVGAVALAWMLWTGLAAVYRQQHCILLFGHWVSVERTTIPLFCQ